jgi:formate hydrogenlyase transcriptional activator
MGRFQAADRNPVSGLQERQVERLGGSQTFQVDVRAIAAINRHLWRMVEERKFRADLYYRLNVFPITLPPLRERRDDIPLLIEHFVQKFAERQGKGIVRVPDEAMELLKLYDWPGKIRELQNVIERGVIMTTGSVLSPQMMAHMRPDRGSVPVRTLVDAERAHISATLRETNWVVADRVEPPPNWDCRGQP